MRVLKNIRIYLVSGCLCAALLLGGCVNPFQSGMLSEATQRPDAPVSALPPVEPLPVAGAQQQAVTLYYRFMSEPMLAPDPVIIEAQGNERIESAVIKELIAGPGHDKVELSGLFSSGVKLLGISESENCLIITLNKNILDVGADVPENWMENSSWRETVNTRRKLALYSIVNTITCMGEYSNVQVLVDMGSGQGTRIRRSQAGFAGETGDNQLLEPLGLNTEYILTPKNTVIQAVKSAENRDFEKLYQYISKSESAEIKYTLEEFLSWSATLGGAISFYQVHDEVVNYDGRSAIVTVSIRFTLKDSSRLEHTDLPVMLVQENGLWKLKARSITALLV